MASSADPLSAHVRTPEDIALRADVDDVAPLLPPDPTRLFAERALRLRQLAAGHAMRDYLMLLALICEAQHARAQQRIALALPTPAQRDAAAEAGEPPLGATCWQRDPQWRADLRALAAQVLERLAADSPARAAVQRAAAMADAELEQQADRLLAGITLGIEMAAAPLIAAGLQLYFTQLVAAAAADPSSGALAVPAPATRCPWCGSLSVASVTRTSGEREGQRYQHCMLCSAQWHFDRVCCTHCLARDGIHFRSLQAIDAPANESGKRPAVEAETCEHCHHYLKIMHTARDPFVEPMADDLATLTLDLLVADAGYDRHGSNLLLLFGDAEPAAD